MILFVFEGEKREPRLFQTMRRLYPELCRADQPIVCSYRANIYSLSKDIRRMMENDEAPDIVQLLKERCKNHPSDEIHQIERSAQVAQVFLFFDYDFHHSDAKGQQFHLNDLNRQVSEMLALFNDEIDAGRGKLYLSYPMAEAFCDTQPPPDANFHTYLIARSECKNYKDRVGKKLSINQITLRPNDASTTAHEDLKSLWESIKKQNVQKANLLCKGSLSWPQEKKDVAQENIFAAQRDKHIDTAAPHVAVLSAFPLFLYDYFPAPTPVLPSHPNFTS